MAQKLYTFSDDFPISVLFGGAEDVTAQIEGDEQVVSIPFRPVLRVIKRGGATYFRLVRGELVELDTDGRTQIDEAFDAAEEAKRPPKL